MKISTESIPNVCRVIFGKMSLLSSVMDKASRPKIGPFLKSSEDMGTFLWANCKYKDFQIVVDDRVLNVHKCVLAARSPVFAAMLTSGMTETQSGQLLIQDFDFDTVHMAIFFFYTQCYGIDTRVESIGKLLEFGNKYDVQHLIKACLHEIKIKKIGYDKTERKFLIKLAFDLGSDQILDSILSIFGSIVELELVHHLELDNNDMKEIGDVLFQDESFKDLKIICDDGVEFSVHKCILALKSPVFAQMIEKMDEKGDTSGRLTITGIRSINFEKVVRYFYWNPNINDDQDYFQHFKITYNLRIFLLELLEFADKFKVEDLVSLCLQKINPLKKCFSKEMVSTWIKTSANFESQKIFHFILGIFRVQGFENWNFDIEFKKASMESYWN